MLAVALFLGCALWALRVVLPAPASTFPHPTKADATWEPIIHADQKLSAATITWNAHRFTTRPWQLYDAGQCYPAPRAATLGPHMLGEGLAGVVPHILAGDPILTYNFVAVVSLFLPALTMYILVLAFTGSTPAAVVAGLVFALHPARIGDVIHPDVHGNHWAPLALLFAHRTFTRGGWRDAAGLALFLCLQVLESIYPLLAFVVFGGTYGLFLALASPRRLLARTPQLLAAAAAAGLVAWLVLGPYLETRAAWGTLGGRTTLLYNPEDFGRGGAAYPGSMLLILAAIGLADRLRGRRRTDGEDPRVAYLVGGLMIAWSAVWGISIFGLGIPSLFTLASRVLPGLDAVRAGAAIGFGVVLAGAFLAGYGVLVLIERASSGVRTGVAALLAVAVLVEVFHPAVATYSFGASNEMAPYAARPPAQLIDLYRTAPDGAVLDVPYGFKPGRFFEMADDVLLSAFHLHPVGACYNSFKLPLHDDIQRLAERLWEDPRAVDALHALGFSTLVIDNLRAFRHTEGNYYRINWQPGILPLIGHGGLHSAYRLLSTAPIETSFAAIADAGKPPVVALAAAPPDTALAFTFRNGTDATYRHPEPIAPTRVRVRWRALGKVIREDETAMLLPVALAAGDEASRTITVPVPTSPGAYEVTLAPVGTPDLVLARQSVEVRASAPLAHDRDAAAPEQPGNAS